MVYFGYNDIKADKSLSNAKNQYRAQVDRLIANGVTQGQCRLVLCLLHDWSRNPGATRSYRARVTEWNRHVRNVAAARPNCVVVDLFSLFERVFADPGAYGFTNVTQPNRALSASRSRQRARISGSCSSASSSMPLLSAPTGDSRSWHRREQSRLANSWDFIRRRPCPS